MADVDCVPIAPFEPGVFWDSRAHRGFNFGLFGQFRAGSEFQVPYGEFQACATFIDMRSFPDYCAALQDLLVQQLERSYARNAKLHFTVSCVVGEPL